MKRTHNQGDVSASKTINGRANNGCFIQEVTTNEVIHHKTYHVESDSVSFSVTYQKNLNIHDENRDGHELKFPLQRNDPVRKLEHTIPNQFLVSKETCFVHVMIVLSEMHLPHAIQEHLVEYISTESVDFSRGIRGEGGGGGFKVEANVEINRARRVKRKVMATDCSICSMELYSAVSRMELHCSHIFHRDCVMEWLEKNLSCPICLTKALGETVSIY